MHPVVAYLVLHGFMLCVIGGSQASRHDNAASLRIKKQALDYEYMLSDSSSHWQIETASDCGAYEPIDWAWCISPPTMYDAEQLILAVQTGEK